MLNKVALTFKSAVDEILVCGHSNESYWNSTFMGMVFAFQNQVCRMKIFLIQFSTSTYPLRSESPKGLT